VENKSLPFLPLVRDEIFPNRCVSELSERI